MPAIANKLITLSGTTPANKVKDSVGVVVDGKVYTRGHWIADSNSLIRVDITQATITDGDIIIDAGISYGAFDSIDGLLVLSDESGSLAMLAFNAQIIE